MIALLTLALCFGSVQEQERTTWTVVAERLWTAPGQVVENGVVVIRDGKIASVGSGGGRDDEGTLRVAAVTPGMIDLSARLTTGMTSVEQSREVTPELRIEQGLDLFDPAWKRLAQSGVTTALINPPDENVIGGLGVVLKTAGPTSIEARTVKSRAVLRGAVGTQPSRRNHPVNSGRADDFYSRRPTTRMGVEYVLRKALYEAAYSKGDAKRAFPGSTELLDVLAGKLPFVVQAWATQDIRTSVYAKEEMEREGFGSINLIIDSGAEAWREPDLLVRTKTAVVLPPFPWQGRTQDSALLPLNTLRVLLDRGLRVALSAHGSAEADEALDDQAALAIRGGATFDEALAAVTTTPAELIGISDRVGTLGAGKDGDCVLWNGTPFEPTSRVVGVIVDGRLVLDPRPPQED